MKKIISCALLSISFCSLSQTDVIKDINATADMTHITVSSVNEEKYYITGSFTWDSSEYPVNVDIDVIETTIDNDEVVVKSLHIANNPELFGPFDPNNPSFFIESDRVHFSIGPLDQNIGRVLTFTGNNNTGHVIQTACQRIVAAEPLFPERGN